MISKKDIQAYVEKGRILIKGSDYLYLLPQPDLRTYISNYTITFPKRGTVSDTYTIMPHGSATLVVSRDFKKLGVELFGPISKSVVVGKKSNQNDMLLILEFQPSGLYALTGITQNELINKVIPFDTVNLKLKVLICEAVEKSKSVIELVSALDILLLTNMYTTHHPQLKVALQTIIKEAGNVTVKNLAEDVHYSERQLNRIFGQQVGMNVKTFSRMVRINKVFRLMKNPNHTISLISDASGFHDVPHFIHDFKTLCGISPQEYRNDMSDFYSEINKF